MIEKILFWLVVLDVLTYNIMTFSASWHNKKTHHFWKSIPLHWMLAVYFLFIVGWLGYALMRLGII